MKPLGMRQEVYDRYLSDGFSDDEIQDIWQDTLVMRDLIASRYGQSREITSTTYETAQRRLKSKVDDWFNGGGRR